ncbi:helix-turn-helix domain-containing protein [Opitutaceae bacterium EW11]|nr:helix-turn-helix domain-containing protein [Opitutaceae bacterium EW11]
MDSFLTAAARLLSAGDPLGALKRIALREDAPALALRGIAMAQLGDYPRARELLRRAARRFGARERLAQARCRVAEAEVALASRDLPRATHGLDSAARVLEAHGDRANAVHARLIGTRFHLLVGEIEDASETLASIDLANSGLPPALLARAELTQAELCLRRIRITDASAALDRAAAAARAAGIPALVAEVGRVRNALSAPSARLIRRGVVQPLRLDEAESLFASGDLVIDACRREVRRPGFEVRLAGRPVLFGLVRQLAEAWPADVPRDRLITETFGARSVHPSHRVRLRVEIGRLRVVLRRGARIESTPRGFRLLPLRAPNVAVVAPPNEGPAGAILALLEDGECWSTSALSRALGSSQRTVQRTLRELEETAAVHSVGRGRSRCWLAPALSGFATTLLLPRSLQVG